jgi:hypothetical protein
MCAYEIDTSYVKGTDSQNLTGVIHFSLLLGHPVRMRLLADFKFLLRLTIQIDLVQHSI